MTNICRICGNTKDNINYTAREMMYGSREEFGYFQCDSCDCLQIESVPENMGKYYPGDYYSFSKYDGKKFEGIQGSVKKMQYKAAALGGSCYQNTLGRLFGKKEYDIFNDLDVTSTTRILDVGCGNGRNFLYPLAEVGFTNVRGCDPYLEQPISYENGLNIENVGISDIEGSFDIITYHHAFEHLEKPFENLRKVYELLAKNGVCIIRIPTVSSHAWEHYGTDWVQLDAPRHIFLHSTKSMEILARKSGFEVYDVEFDSTHFQFTGSEKYLKDIPLSDPKPSGFSESVQRKYEEYAFGQQATKLNKADFGDQAAFYLRKK
jgi:2-polyprenyl-3-methyl-5-hydroxy-6-metoxy-1,4-benzoquinol methylase